MGKTEGIEDTEWNLANLRAEIKRLEEAEYCLRVDHCYSLDHLPYARLVADLDVLRRRLERAERG